MEYVTWISRCSRGRRLYPIIACCLLLSALVVFTNKQCQDVPSQKVTNIRTIGLQESAAAEPDATSNLDPPNNDSFLSPPAVKTEQWFNKSLKRLNCRIIKTPPTMSDDPFFLPDRRDIKFEAKHKEVISCPKCSDSTLMVFLILSEPEKVKDRNEIRQTWGSVQRKRKWPGVNVTMNVRLVFVIGSRRDNGNSSSRLRDNYLLVEEAKKFGDVLQVNTLDHYSNLTRKIVDGFKWVSKNCQNVKYIIKCDMDIFVNVPLLWHFLKQKQSVSNAMYGHVYNGGHVHRIGKWALSNKTYPLNRFPPYVTGTTYVLTYDAMLKVLKMYKYFYYTQIEDGFVTGIVATAAKIDRYFVQGFTHWKEGSISPCKLVMDERFNANDVIGERRREFWETINSRGNGKCSHELRNGR